MPLNRIKYKNKIRIALFEKGYIRQNMQEIEIFNVQLKKNFDV